MDFEKFFNTVRHSKLIETITENKNRRASKRTLETLLPFMEKRKDACMREIKYPSYALGCSNDKSDITSIIQYKSPLLASES